MCFVAELASVKIGLDRKVVDQHYKVLRALKLPTEYQLSAWTELLQAMGLDKKAKSGNLRFVAIEEIGKCTRIESPTSEELQAAYERIAK